MPTVAGSTTVLLSYTDGGVVETPEQMVLVIADTAQQRAPTSLEVTLSGADAGEDLDFDMGGGVIWTATADDNGSLFLTSIPIPVTDDGTDLGPDAGTYTLTATGVRTASADFTLARPPSDYPQVQAADVDPVEIPGRGNSWAFQDPRPGGLGSWVMHPSPTSMTEPELEKTVDVDHSSSPTDGEYHLSVADTGVKPWSFSGYCPNKTFHDKLVAYGALNRRIYVLDHRGRAWKVTILRPDIVPRKRQIEDDGTAQDWASDYTITANIMDTVSFEPVAP